MPNNAEKKNIARLDFKVDDAINSLQRVNKELEAIAQKAEGHSKTISQAMNKSFSGYDYSKDIAALQKKMKKYEQLTIAQQQTVSTSLHKEMNKRYTKQVEHNQKTERQQQKTADKERIINSQKNARIEIDNNKHQNKMEEMNARQLKSTKTMYDKIAGYAKTYLIYQGFNELRRGITETIEEMVEVQYQMTAIDRVLNESGLNIDAYRDKLIQLAYDYGNSFENVADITLRLAQAGFDSNESLMLTENTLLALNTAELDATQATEDMVAVMAQWGLMTGTATQKADAYGSIIDKINKVADNFPTTSADIMEALKKTSSAFNIAGASIDETIASIVAAETASQRGGKAIGTALSNIAQQLKAEGRLNLAEQMGLDFFTDASKTEFRPIMDIFGDMATMMQNLKDQGKESSVEMQNLLEMFTVFRRNIGASLLGEMAGEDSTYAQVLKTSLNSVGYSLQENEKHMKTAKAAQAQFNAELLKLKTAVWDNGVEDVFRDMLNLGTDLVSGIGKLIDKFGLLPTTVAAVTLAFSLLNKNTQATNWIGLRTKIQEVNAVLTQTEYKTSDLNKALKGTSSSFTTYAKGIKTGTASLKGYAGYLVTTTAKTVLLTAKTILLQTVISGGLTIIIGGLVTVIDKWVHAEENAIEAAETLRQETETKISEYKTEIEEIQDLVEEYDNLKKSYEDINSIQTDKRTVEQQQELELLTNDIKISQEKITALLKEQRQYTANLIDDYDAQYLKIKEILKDKKEELLVTQKTALIAAKEANKAGRNYADKNWWWGGTLVDWRISDNKGWSDTLKEVGFTSEYFYELNEVAAEFADTWNGLGKSTVWEYLDALSSEEQLQVLEEMVMKLQEGYFAGEDYGEVMNFIASEYKALKESQDAVTEAQEVMNETIASIKLDELISDEGIDNLKEYEGLLEKIDNLTLRELPTEYFSGNSRTDLINFKKDLRELARNTFPEYNESTKESTLTLEEYNQKMSDVANTITNLQTQYTALSTAQNELNQTGQLTASTFASLVNNNLLQYLEIVDGKLVVTEASFLNAANAAKEDAKAKLQDAAASNILEIVEADLQNASKKTEEQQKKTAKSSETVREASQRIIAAKLGEIVTVRALIQEYENEKRAKEGMDIMPIDWSGLSDEATRKIQTEIDKVNAYTKAIDRLTLTRASINTSRGSSSDSAEYAAKKAAEEAKKAAEEAYKARLDAFKDYIDETERLEKRWVDKQEDLGQLSNEDYFYIIQQRINRYKKYLEEVKKATWMAEEDRLDLIKEYTEEIEDLQVDYFKYLQDQLDDEIDALEKANDEKIKLIEEEADARIAALDKVSAATDRAREEEDYQNERQKILEEIAYWEQRTGREAQEALVEARKSLEELDAEWADQLEDWSIEDQIAQIEAERDAEIAAIEAAQAKEIEAMQSVYDAKVKLFVETGQIIYDGSVIQAQNLYNAYKNNFIDPISSELAKLNTAPVTSTPAVSETTTATEQQYETYKIKSGDTLSKIAKNYGTTIEKIMAANPYVTNKNRIYAGKTLQIPKFHEGGIVGGNQEAFALLKPHEVILKPEWAEGINRLAKMARNMDNPITNNSTTVEVKGDLVKIEANIKDKTDAEYLTRRVEKMLKDKFNIKK